MYHTIDIATHPFIMALGISRASHQWLEKGKVAYMQWGIVKPGKNEAMSLAGTWMGLKVILCFSDFPYYYGQTPDKKQLKGERVNSVLQFRDTVYHGRETQYQELEVAGSFYLQLESRQLITHVAWVRNSGSNPGAHLVL